MVCGGRGRGTARSTGLDRGPAELPALEPREVPFDQLLTGAGGVELLRERPEVEAASSLGGLDRPVLEGLPALGQRGPDDVGNARKVFSMCRLANNSFLDRTSHCQRNECRATLG